MSQVCIILSLVLLSFRLISGYAGDNVLLPPYQVRTMDQYRSPALQQYASQFQGNRQTNRPQQVLQTDVIHKRPPQVPMMEKQSEQNITFGEFMAALNEMSQHGEEESQLLRTAGSAGRDDSPTYPSRPIGYSGSNYVAPAVDSESPSVLTPPPSTTQPKIPLLKPDFSGFLKPVATKAPGKLDGLLGLVFSLLTSSSGTHSSGLKGVLIEGILKPLLTANGGIKAVISKLTIPVICLVLINIEVLVVVWWMWEECPAIPKPLPIEPNPTYPTTTSPTPYSKPVYNYNSYN